MNIDLAKSYLQARDPSIISYNRTNLDNFKVDLADLMKSSNTETKAEEKTKENRFINVYLRIRGDIDISDIYKLNGTKFTCKVPEGSYALRNVKGGDSMKRIYTFTNIFGPEFNQKTIFDCIVKPKLVSFINGSNSTLFTYGASGSGKTYTIVGTPEEPGLIPRALEYVFRSLPTVSIEPEIKPLPNGTAQNITPEMMIEHTKYKNLIVNPSVYDQTFHISTYKEMQNRLSMEPIAEVTVDSDVSVSAWISFAEIYNETIYDLLSLPNTKNKVRQRLALGKFKDNRTYIKKLTYLHVTNGLEAYQILQYGLHNLNYAVTAVNSHSSRSHCIFTIHLVQSSKSSRDVYISDFNFCDLAGSERLKKTMNIGDRLKESNNINTSLLVLGRCMDRIKKCQQAKDKRLIPFRESKLTQIFQKALMGYENVEMIVNVNLSRDMFDETIHVLNFSALANTIVVEEELPKPIKNRFSIMMQKEEPPIDNKIIINEHRDYASLKKKLYESQNEIRSLKKEINRLNLEVKQNVIDPNEEIERLHKAIDTIIDERDNIMATYEKRIIEEKETLLQIHKDSMERYAILCKENDEQTIRRLREEYEEKIAEMQSITISSDDDESPQKSSSDRYKEELEQSENIRKLQKQKLEYAESLLEDAKEEYRSSQLELKRITQENNHLKSEVVELKEEFETLKLLLMHQSTNFCDADSSGPEDSESQEPIQTQDT